MEEQKPKIVDINKEEPKSEIPEKVSEESIKEISGLAGGIDNVLKTIGSIEAQKIKLFFQSEELREKLEQKAKQALLDAGVPEEKVEEYSLDIRSGKIIEKRKVSRNKQ